MKRVIFFTSAIVLSTLVGCGDDTGGSGAGGGSSSATGTGTGTGTGSPSSSDSSSSSADTSSSSSSADTSSSSSSSSSGTGTGGGDLLPFGASCEDDTECETGLCYAFGMGAKCTVPCPDDPQDCPGQTKQCNNMDPAVCKTP